MALDCVVNAKSRRYFILLENDGERIKAINTLGNVIDITPDILMSDPDGEVAVEMVDEGSPKIDELQMQSYREYEATRPPSRPAVLNTYYAQFRISLTDYQALIRPMNRYASLQINVEGGANHPAGHYLIPKEVVRRKIESREWEPHWTDYECHSDSNIPAEFRPYWHEVE